jgi:hypothetical protein
MGGEHRGENDLTGGNGGEGNETGFQPSSWFGIGYLARCARLVWNAPLALSLRWEQLRSDRRSGFCGGHGKSFFDSLAEFGNCHSQRFRDVNDAEKSGIADPSLEGADVCDV